MSMVIVLVVHNSCGSQANNISRGWIFSHQSNTGCGIWLAQLWLHGLSHLFFCQAWNQPELDQCSSSFVVMIVILKYGRTTNAVITKLFRLLIIWATKASTHQERKTADLSGRKLSGLWFWSWMMSHLPYCNTKKSETKYAKRKTSHLRYHPED